MRLLRVLSLLAAAAALLTGCGEGGDTGSAKEKAEPWAFQSVELTLDGRPSPETAGLIKAYELDTFFDVGVGMTIYAPVFPGRPIQYVEERSVDLAVTHLPQVVLAQEKGAQIVAVGSVVPEPTLSMIWLKGSKIDGIADLKGKTIAFPGLSFQAKFLRAVLERAGLKLSDVKLERVDFELVPALVSGRADAIFGGSWNVEGAELESRGLQPEIIRASELGIPPYDELVVIARRERVDENPELFRRVMEGVRRGTVAARQSPETIPHAVKLTGLGEFDRKALEAGLEPTLPLLSDSGEIDREQTSNLIDWMYEEGMIERKLPVSELIAP